jgi:hypothetical protein
MIARVCDTICRDQPPYSRALDAPHICGDTLNPSMIREVIIAHQTKR